MREVLPQAPGALCPVGGRNTGGQATYRLAEQWLAGGHKSAEFKSNMFMSLNNYKIK